MSRSELERREIKASGSSLRGHSLNQERLKRLREGEAGLLPPRKLIRAQERRERFVSETQAREDEKVARVTQRVITCFRDPNTYPFEILRREVHYLGSFGITLGKLREMATTNTTSTTA